VWGTALKHKNTATSLLSTALLLLPSQVIDYYRSKVVKLEAERAPEAVSKQIREALSKIKHNDD
jgi:hypothetical protein